MTTVYVLYNKVAYMQIEQESSHKSVSRRLTFSGHLRFCYLQVPTSSVFLRLDVIAFNPCGLVLTLVLIEWNIWKSTWFDSVNLFSRCFISIRIAWFYNTSL